MGPAPRDPLDTDGNTGTARGRGIPFDDQDAEREHLAAVFHHVRDLLALAQVEPDGSLTLLAVNAPALAQTGTVAADVLGRRLEDLVPAPQRTTWRAHGAACLGQVSVQAEVVGSNPLELQGYTFEHEVTLAHGRRVFEVRLTPIRDGQHGPDRLLVTAHDATDQRNAEDALRRSEEQLRHSQKMEAIGRLAGGIAHDFNNLLTAINGYSELSQAQLEADHPVHAHLGEIRKAGERAASLTQQLLAYSRKQVLAPKVLNLNAIVAETDKLLRRLIGDDVVLETYLAPDAGWVKVDSGQMHQLLINLAVNARDAMPDGGRLTLATAVAHIAEPGDEQLPAGTYAVLSVRDNGVGMDESVQRHVFEPFYTTKAFGQGTGLGLATVYAVAKQSGGHIDVESQPGKGSLFRVWLPQFAGEEALPGVDPPTLQLEAVRPRQTVFVVEDEGVVLRLVDEILTRRGYTVRAFTSSADALVAATELEGPLHLLLTDVIMADMGGPELARQIRRLRPEVRVLFMSGYTDDAKVKASLVDGRERFLQKPFAPKELVDKVRAALAADRVARNDTF